MICDGEEDSTCVTFCFSSGFRNFGGAGIFLARLSMLVCEYPTGE